MKKIVLLAVISFACFFANAQNPYPILPLDSIGFVNPGRLSVPSGTTIPDYITPFKDTIYRDTVRFDAVVISNPKAYGLSVSRKAAYVQRLGGGPWSGALVMCEPSGTGTTLANLLTETKFYDNMVVGYKVRITGVIRDFQGETQINLIRSNPNWENGVEQLSLTPDSLVYTEITADKLMLGNPNSSARIPQKLTGEQYEGTLVRIKNVTVYSVVNAISGNSNRTAWSVIDDNGNVIEIRDFSSYFRRDALGDSATLNVVNTSRFIAPPIGTRLEYIQGVVTEYSVSGAARYGIAPIYPGDYKICTSCPPSIRFISRNPAVVKSSDTSKLTFEITVGDTTLDISKIYFKNSVSNVLDSANLTPVAGFPNYYLAQIPPTNTECTMTYWVQATDKRNRVTLIPDPFSFGNKYYVTGPNGVDNIRALQTSVVPNGSSIWAGDSLSNMNVRGIITGTGFGTTMTFQDGTGPNSAIFVLRRSATDSLTNWQVGDSVVITNGRISENFSITTITNPIGTVISSGNPLPAFEKGLSIDSFALGNNNYSRKWEGVLMRFDSVEVSSKNPDAPTGSFGEFAVTKNGVNGLRIDDLNNNFKNFNNLVNVGMKMNFIQGPMYFANANFKLVPRSVTDGDFSNIDTIKPVITLLGNVFDTARQGSVYVDAGATATDDKSGDVTSRITTTSNLNINALGDYTIVYKATDVAGNFADSVIRFVTIIVKTDSIKPMITLNGDKVVSLKKDSAYVELGATATDDIDGNITNKISITGTVNSSVIGSYLITYKVRDAQGNSDSVTRTINVMLKTDTIKPVITLNGATVFSVKRDSAYNELGATATDNRDGNITNNIVITGSVNTAIVGTYFITYKVCDVNDNCDSVIRTVNVILRDSIKPVITIKGNQTVNVFRGGSYVEQGATAIDDLDGDISNKIVTEGTVNTSLIGKYIVSYKVSDLAGNKDSVARTVNVISNDTIKPVITILGKNPDTLQKGTVYTDLGATATDNNDGNLTSKITKVSTIDTSKLGTYTITYTVKDSANNTTTVVRTVVVIRNVSVRESSKVASSIKVFPSPASSELNIAIENINQLPAELTIFDILGKEVFSQSIKSKNFSDKISIGQLNNGIYFMSIANANSSQIIKFVVNK